jgi:hypothetical protein
MSNTVTLEEKTISLFDNPETALRIMRRAFSPASAKPEELRKMKADARAKNDKQAEQRISASLLLDKHFAAGGSPITAFVDMAKNSDRTGLKSMSEAVKFGVSEGVIASRGPLAKAADTLKGAAEKDMEAALQGPNPDTVKSPRLRSLLEQSDKIADPVERAAGLNRMANIAASAGEEHTSDAAAKAAVAIAQARIEAYHRDERKRTSELENEL